MVRFGIQWVVQLAATDLRRPDQTENPTEPLLYSRGRW